jgi:hypothetical protein
MLAAAVNSELVEFLWLNPEHIAKDIGLDSTKPRSFGVDAALAQGAIEINAPAIVSH